jgi:hypothetical protein
MAERMVFLRNTTDASLPVLTGNRPAPQPSWGYGVARWDIHKLEPLREVVQQLQQAGLMGADLCQPPHSAPSVVGGNNVDVSQTQLP